ncbi:MAG: IclR family transcriptional regulator [Solirubrobacteraceae bacterium]
MTGGSVTGTGRPAYPIGSVDNALRLLLLFRDRQVVRLSEASEYLGVVRSTAHRLLAMLQYHGFVRQDPDTRAYVAGPALLDVGLAAVRGVDLRARARPYLEALTDTLGETSHFCILQGANLVFVDSVESRQALRTGSRVGVSLPAHCTSGGKALLARMPVETLALLYPDERLVGLTSASVSSLRELESQLEVIRARGWAVNLGESETDIAAVGAAVPIGSSAPRAALAVSGPRSRLSGDALERAGAAVSDAAERLGTGLP